MNVEISRNELAGALNALGKLVSRTNQAEVYRSLRIEGKNCIVSFQTVGSEEAITYAIPVEGVEEFACLVNFDNFRTVVRYNKTKNIALTYEEGQFSVDHTLLATVKTDWPTVAVPSSDAVISVLPEKFVSALATAAPIVDRHEPRRVLQGLHLCKDGIVATNGKELVNIPFPLAVESLTIPFPHALLATKCEEEGTLTVWNEKDQRFFSIALGNWTWTGKALTGNYPDWRKVVPAATVLNRAVHLPAEQAAQLTNFLKSVPADPPNHPVTLGMSDDLGSLDISAGEMHSTFPAAFPENWGDFSVTVNRELLLRLLNQGHHRLAFSTSPGPFIATGGVGRYIAMPLAFPSKNKPQTFQPQKEETMNAMPNVGTVSIMVRKSVSRSLLREYMIF